jgi:uncharacterized damage-inducible protein DinB
MTARSTTAPISLEHVRKLFDYHHWAGNQCFDAVAGLTAAQLDQPWGGSFKTGRGLLAHIVGADRVWIERFGGGSPTRLPELPSGWSGEDFRAEWRRLADAEAAFIRALDGAGLAADLSYVNLKGEPFRYPLHETLVHLVNHGTYHRGQIAHLLRDMGMPAPSTDYVRFLQVRT